MRSIVDRGSILRKINIPKYVIVVSTSLSALINLGINLVIVLIFAIISGVHFTPMALLIIPLLIELYIFALAVAMILSALYVKFRDLAHIWDVVMQAMYFAMPVFYPLSMVMHMNMTAAKVMLLNPMAQIIQDARKVLTYNQTETVWGLFNFVPYMLIPLVLVAVLAVIAVLYFRQASKRFTELV